MCFIFMCLILIWQQFEKKILNHIHFFPYQAPKKKIKKSMQVIDHDSNNSMYTEYKCKIYSDRISSFFEIAITMFENMIMRKMRIMRKTRLKFCQTFFAICQNF